MGGNGEREDKTPQQGLCGGGTGHSSGEMRREPFTLLLHVLQNNGAPVPPSLFMAPNTAELVQEVTGTIPVNVEVVTDSEVVIDLDETVLAVGVMQQLQGSLIWGCHVTNVT